MPGACKIIQQVKVLVLPSLVAGAGPTWWKGRTDATVTLQTLHVRVRYNMYVTTFNPHQFGLAKRLTPQHRRLPPLLQYEGVLLLSMDPGLSSKPAFPTPHRASPTDRYLGQPHDARHFLSTLSQTCLSCLHSPPHFIVHLPPHHPGVQAQHKPMLSQATQET